VRFRHKQYRHCLYKTATHKLQFTDWEAETDDADLIKSLKANPNIEVIGENTVDPIEEEKEAKTTDLKRMKATELRDLARERGIKGYSEMSKDELIKVLEG
jgi:Rho termination factor, N-terminal domain